MSREKLRKMKESVMDGAGMLDAVFQLLTTGGWLARLELLAVETRHIFDRRATLYSESLQHH